MHQPMADATKRDELMAIPHRGRSMPEQPRCTQRVELLWPAVRKLRWDPGARVKRVRKLVSVATGLEANHDQAAGRECSPRQSDDPLQAVIVRGDSAENREDFLANASVDSTSKLCVTGLVSAAWGLEYYLNIV